jgi:hypothetical protein
MVPRLPQPELRQPGSGHRDLKMQKNQEALTAIRATDHPRFYFYALVCAVMVVFAGFAQSYFLKTIFGVDCLCRTNFVTWLVSQGVEQTSVSWHQHVMGGEGA